MSNEQYIFRKHLGYSDTITLLLQLCIFNNMHTL